ncbi:MAG: 30S ribosomal protein S9, partial [Pseudomonadota bacterium]
MAEEITSLEELKEAVGVADAESPVEEPRAPLEPVRDEHGRSYATGKRKDAVARVWVKPGNGKVTVNGKDMATYFARPVLQMVIGQPFDVANATGEFDVMCTVKG